MNNLKKLMNFNKFFKIFFFLKSKTRFVVKNSEIIYECESTISKGILYKIKIIIVHINFNRKGIITKNEIVKLVILAKDIYT